MAPLPGIIPAAPDWSPLHLWCSTQMTFPHEVCPRPAGCAVWFPSIPATYNIHACFDAPYSVITFCLSPRYPHFRIKTIRLENSKHSIDIC